MMSSVTHTHTQSLRHTHTVEARSQGALLERPLLKSGGEAMSGIVQVGAA
jgi:hypothetical protein